MVAIYTENQKSIDGMTATLTSYLLFASPSYWVRDCADSVVLLPPDAPARAKSGLLLPSIAANQNGKRRQYSTPSAFDDESLHRLLQLHHLPRQPLHPFNLIVSILPAPHPTCIHSFKSAYIHAQYSTVPERTSFHHARLCCCQRGRRAGHP